MFLKIRQFLMVVLAIAAASSCSTLEKMCTYPDVTAELTDSLIVGEDGTFPLNCKITVPSQYRSIHTAVLLYSDVESADGSETIYLDSLAVDGKFNSTFNDRMSIYQENLSDSITVRYSYAPKGQDTEITISDTLAFKPWMENSNLDIDAWGESYGDREHLALIRIPLHFILPKPEPEPEKPVTYVECRDSLALGSTSFRIGSYNVDSLATDVKSRVEEICSDTTVVSIKAIITGSCSPEGPAAFNEELSQNRADAVANLLRAEGIENIEIVSMGINWDMLYSWLNDNGHSKVAEKIQKIDDSSERYQQFRDNSYEVWKTARRSIFRAMRYADVEIRYTKKVLENE